MSLLVAIAGCGGGHATSDGGRDGYADASATDGGPDASVAADASSADAAIDQSDTGSSVRDGADGRLDATPDGAVPCTPCNLQLGALIAGCSDGVSTAGCVVQTSLATNADGTTINVANQCFAGGAKLLTTKISGSFDAGAFVSSTSERIKDGQTCMTQQTSGVRSTAGLVATDLFLDGAGHVVATVMTNAVAGADGGVVQIQTMTCPGQPAEPYRVCMPPAPGADAGDGGDAGDSSVAICTPGTCS